MASCSIRPVAFMLVLLLLLLLLVQDGGAQAADVLGSSSVPAGTAAATNKGPTDTNDPFTSRQTVWLDMPGTPSGKFALRMPRMNRLEPGAPTSIRLRVNDTCGLFTVFHTAAGTGDTRVFTHQKATKLIPGRLPGFNVPSIDVGSAVLTGKGNGVDTWGGQLVLSPAGSVHYFVRETDITDFFTIYMDGFADELIINYILYGPPATPYDVLLFTGLYGIPTDMTGKFVGMPDDTGALKLYRQARGPIDVPNSYAAALRLQAIFDLAEVRKCCKTCGGN